MNALDTLGPLVDRVAQLQAAQRGTPHFEWGTITSVAPLAVQLDGDPGPLLGTPSTLVSGLRVNDRVRVEIQNRQVTIHGRAAASVGDTGWTTLTISGTSSGGWEWRRENGKIRYVFDFTLSTSLVASGALDQWHTLPVACRPKTHLSGGRIPLNVAGSGTYSAVMLLLSNGSLTLRNLHTSAHARYVGAGEYEPAS